MTLSQTIAACLSVGIRGYSMNEEAAREDVRTLRDIGCKGVILFDRDIPSAGHRNILSPDQLTRFIADLRHELGDDLIVSIDQEGGGVSRLTKERGFLESVSARELGAWEPIDVEQYALRHARQLASLGIDLNLAPCVDLSIEPDSPIIAKKGRAYSREHDTAVRCATAFIEQHRRAGVACCIKHFPGHGSTLIDTHNGMCDITRTRSPEETRVFSTLIEHFGEGVGVMAGHLIDRSVDDALPASLSPAHLTGVLRGRMGFGGVIVSDSLDMRAIRDHYGEGDAALMALRAGCDLIIDGFNAPGLREPGGVGRIVDSVGHAIINGRWPGGERRLHESGARIQRLMGRG